MTFGLQGVYHAPLKKTSPKNGASYAPYAQLIDQAKSVLKPNIAAIIAMEYAVPMSRVLTK